MDESTTSEKSDLSSISYNHYDEINYDCSIKLTDFGLAHIIPDGEQFAFAKFSCGTHQYKAPEVTNVKIIKLKFSKKTEFIY